MKVGDLVRHKKHFGAERVGLVCAIGSPNPIAKILWLNGDKGAMHIKFLEVVNENN